MLAWVLSKTLLSKHLVDGLDVMSKKIAGMCEDCILAKQTCCPFDEIVMPETKILACAHIDLWGPASGPVDRE